MRAFAKAVPAEEYRLVDSGAAATMSAVSTALGPSRGRTAQVDIGARYLVVIKVSTPTQYYRQTDSYKCIASVLVQVFDESGQLIGIAEQEATRPAFDEHESVRTALRAACSALVGRHNSRDFWRHFGRRNPMTTTRKKAGVQPAHRGGGFLERSHAGGRPPRAGRHAILACWRS
jgi:hypothetical protein